jgi:MbtH protein
MTQQKVASVAYADDQDIITYAVVVNDEEQYSIWPAGRTLPAGWRSVGVEGAKSECLDHISQVWTDLRPLSVRQ